MKNCPFKQEKCNDECALFISAKELNETAKNRLRALGVMSDEEGLCSIKNMALAQSRYIFENSKVFK